MNLTCPVCGNQDWHNTLSVKRYPDHLHVTCFALVKVLVLGGRKTCLTEWDTELPQLPDGPWIAGAEVPF